jgi:phage/plasmid-like protein (TIGR03299 family)
MQPAWHGLGQVLDHAPDSKTAMTAACLDWRVEKVPLMTDEGTAVPDWFATVRRDTGSVLGVVGAKYRIVQNADAFEFLDGLLQDGVIRYESAGALRGGRIVWALARMPSVDAIVPGDNVLRYILFSTSHDGSASLHAIPTSVRVVCANTFRVATARDVGFRHTGDVASKLAVARMYLSQFDEKFTLFRDHARILATSGWTNEQAREYVERLFPQVEADGRSRSIREAKVAEVRTNLRSPRQNLPGIKGTWWALFNAVTEFVDHSERRSRKTRQAKETRMLSVTNGQGADFKDRAFRYALEMAGVSAA